MKWEEYSKNFVKLYKANNIEDEIISDLLSYSEVLFNNNIPIILDGIHLSKLVGYDLNYIYAASNAQNQFYRKFTIPKKNGKKRFISEPLPSLKEIQYWILENILHKFKINDYIKSYVIGRSIKDNAKFHKGQKKVLTIDIKDYFTSIKKKKVYNFFKKIGYSKEVSGVFSNLCTLNNSLPQGAPTSPTLSNILTNRLDIRIANYCKKNKIRYTRYADDLTFSGDFETGEMIKVVRKILSSENFIINEKKIRVRYQHQKQEVTGIVVNEKLQAPQTLRKKLREEVYYIEKYGLEEHLIKKEISNPNYLDHLIGIANFVIFINPKDEKAKEYKMKLLDISRLNL